MDTQPIRVLLVEDNPGDARVVREMVRDVPDLDIHHVDRLATAIDYLAREKVDVVLLDLGLPDSQGLETLRAIVQQGRSVPVVVLTGHDDEAAGQEAVRQGAQDYLVKGRVADRALTRAVRYAIERGESQARLCHLNQVLAGVRRVNQLIVREQDPRRLIEGTCQALVETRGCRGAWIAIGGQHGVPGEWAEAGWGAAFAPLTARLRAGPFPQCWEIARAAENGVALFDPSAACPECPLSTISGCERAMVATLRHETREFGLLAVYCARGSAVDEEEEALLGEVAGDIAFALHSIERERQRDQYARIVTASQEPMALVNRAYEYLEANPSYLRLAGYGPRESAGHLVPDILGEEIFLHTVKPWLDRCLAGEEVRGETMRDVPGVGRRILESDYSPCRDSDGSISAVAVCLRDVTEGRRANEALRASEVRYRRLFESAKDGILILDAETGRVVDVNPFLMQLLGYSHEQFLGKTIWDLGFLGDLIANRDKFRELRCQEYVRYEHLPLSAADGRLIDVEFVSNVYVVGDAKVIQCNIRDMTERARAAREIQESKQLIEAVVENVPLMLFLKEAQDLRFVVFNRAGEELLGYDRKELLGKNNLDLFPPEQAAFFMAKDREVLARGVPLDIPEEPILTAKKGQRLLHTRKVCIKGADGATKYLLGISEDITERRQAQGKIERQLEELQRWQDVMLGREDRVQELKREVNELCRRAGEPARYGSQEAGPAVPDGTEPR